MCTTTVGKRPTTFWRKARASHQGTDGKNAFPVADNRIENGLFVFDQVILDPSPAGFMAAVTESLAEAHISVVPFAAFSTDQVFVAEHDAKTAQEILENHSIDSKP